MFLVIFGCYGILNTDTEYQMMILQALQNLLLFVIL